MKMEQEFKRKETDLKIRETRLETAEMELRLKQRRATAPSMDYLSSYKANVGSTNKVATNTIGTEHTGLTRQSSWQQGAAAPLSNATNTIDYKTYQFTQKKHEQPLTVVSTAMNM